MSAAYHGALYPECMTLTHGAPPAGAPMPGIPGPPPGPPGYEWRPIKPHRNTGLLIAVVAATVIGITGLVVGIVGLTRPAPAPLSAPTSAAPTAATQTGDPVAGAKALCTAMGPLFAENDKKSNAWQATGDPGTPARDAALPGYRAFIEDWAGRAQDIVNAHPDADPFMTRTTQRFIDDMVLLVRNMRPGPSKQPDDEAWADSMTAYGGPLSVCQSLGIKW